jgi:hypothetical protein
MNTIEQYPTLSELLEQDFLPDCINAGIELVAGNIYVKNHIPSSHHTIVDVHRNLTLLIDGECGFDVIPGSNIRLLVNPANNQTLEHITEINAGLNVHIPIQEYVENFSVSQFGSAEDFFAVIETIIGYSDSNVIALFLLQSEISTTQFVSDINTHYNFNTPLNPALTSELYGDIALIDEEIYNHQEINKSIIEVYFDVYFSSMSLQQIFDFFNIVFKSFFDTKPIDFIKALLTPQITASVNDINLALEFPRNLLIPLDNTGNPLPEPAKSRLSFTVGSIEYTTENGLQFNGESAVSFPKSQIGNTGFTLQFQDMKLDLSRTRNIAEASASGYPADFVGVFVQSAEIGLPAQWFQPLTSNSSTLGIFGENLLLGTGGSWHSFEYKYAA